MFFNFGACSVDDQTFLQLANVASKDFVPQEIPSQEYETQDEPLLDMEEEDFLDTNPKGRSANYTTAEDKLLCVA